MNTDDYIKLIYDMVQDQHSKIDDLTVEVAKIKTVGRIYGTFGGALAGAIITVAVTMITN